MARVPLRGPIVLTGNTFYADDPSAPSHSDMSGDGDVLGDRNDNTWVRLCSNADLTGGTGRVEGYLTDWQPESDRLSLTDAVAAGRVRIYIALRQVPGVVAIPPTSVIAGGGTYDQSGSMGGFRTLLFPTGQWRAETTDLPLSQVYSSPLRTPGEGAGDVPTAGQWIDSRYWRFTSDVLNFHGEALLTEVWFDDAAPVVVPPPVEAPPVTTRAATRQYPRDDSYGWGGSPRVHPRPRSDRLAAGHL